MAAPSRLVLGYWDIRGYATPIRLMLEYAGADYEDRLYTCGGPPDFDRSHWTSDKLSHGLDFPNLPYLLDGDVKLSQSLAIMRHLARKFGLSGKTDADLARAELAEAQVRDYHNEMARVAYNPACDAGAWAEYLRGVPAKLAALAKFLGARSFVAGEYVTHADFLLFEFLEFHLKYAPAAVAAEPTLVAFHARVLALPAINKYVNSDKFIKFPFNNPAARIGGRYTEQLSSGE